MDQPKIAEMNFAVVGAGISGLSTGALLKQRGYSSTIFEGRSVGGLIGCSDVDGSLFHRVGGHVFNSKNQSVLDWFWSFFDKDKEFLQASRNAVIAIEGRYINYPIELNLAQLPPRLSTQAIGELIGLSGSWATTSSSRSSSFREFLLSTFGPTLCDLYFFRYNQKIWRRNLEEMSVDWLEGKLPMASPQKILESNILKSHDDMVHSRFFYPKRGGSQFIVDRLSADATIINDEVLLIQSGIGKSLRINQYAEAFEGVFYTGDIRNIRRVLSDSLLSILGISEDEWRCLSALGSNPTTTLLCECDANDYSWVYLPSDTTPFHRIIMTGNFSPENNGARVPPARITCTVECSGYMPEADIASKTKNLPFNIIPLSYNYCESSYIIHDHGTRELVSKVTSSLEAINIFCVGRFAEWEYYNMDAAIAAAMRAVDRLDEA